MKYSKIKYVSLTIARNYVNYYVFYESGRRVCKFVDCCPDKFMLYPMEFLRMNRNLRHITYQLSIHRIIPKSIHSWILSDCPQVAYSDNEFSPDIFYFTIADSDYSIFHDTFEKVNC